MRSEREIVVDERLRVLTLLWSEMILAEREDRRETLHELVYLWGRVQSWSVPKFVPPQAKRYFHSPP